MNELIKYPSGGKSKSISHRGAIHDMGTVYITADYQEVKKLIAKYTPNKLKDPEVAFVWPKEASSSSKSIKFSTYAFLNLIEKHKNPRFNIQVYVANLILKYIRLHNLYLGTYVGDLMPEPSDDNKFHIRGSFMDYLVRNNLEDLRDLFIATFSLQGYGQLDEVPALYGLMWHTPNFMRQLNRTINGVPGGDKRFLFFLSQYLLRKFTTACITLYTAA